MNQIEELSIHTHLVMWKLRAAMIASLTGEGSDRGEVSSYMILMAAIVAAAVIVAPQVAKVITDQGTAVVNSTA